MPKPKPQRIRKPVLIGISALIGFAATFGFDMIYDVPGLIYPVIDGVITATLSALLAFFGWSRSGQRFREVLVLMLVLPFLQYMLSGLALSIAYGIPLQAGMIVPLDPNGIAFLVVNGVVFAVIGVLSSSHGLSVPISLGSKGTRVESRESMGLGAANAS